MLILKSLSLQNIGRFIEPQTVDLIQLGSLVQLEGQNNITSGSSGAGKSTIFKALNWLLGLDGPATTILQSRLTKDHIEVSAVFDFDGQPLKISRGRKLSIELNGEVVTGSSKLSEEKLDSIIGMPRDLFSKILHKKQGSGGFFLDMGATETHKFLTNCLGLQKERAKLDVLDIKLIGLEKEEIKLKSDLESNNTGLKATESAIVSLGEEPVNTITTEVLESLTKAHIESSNTHQLVLSTLQTQMEELEKARPVFVPTPFDRTRIVDHEKQIEALDAEIAVLNKLEQDRQNTVKAKIAELQIKIGQLQTTEITRQNEVKNKISQLRVQASQYLNAESTRQNNVKNQISAIQLEISKLQGLEQNRQNEARSKISSLQIDLIKNQALIHQDNKAKEEATLLAKELQKVRSAECPTCNQSWITDACKAKEAEILAKLSEYKKAVIAGNEAAKNEQVIKDQIESLKLETQPKSIPEVNILNTQIAQLKLDMEPKPIPEILVINEQVKALTIEAEPQVVPEIVETHYQIEHIKKEAEVDMVYVGKVNSLSQSKFLASQMLGFERKQESDHQFKESQKQQLLMDNYAQKQTELRKEHQNTIQFAQDSENKALQDLNAAKYQIKAFDEARAKFQESKKKLSIQFDKYHENICLTSQDLLRVQEELELAQEAKTAIKSYLSCSFEDALESIGDTATKFIRNIPNMQTSTIQFDGLKENKDGKIKEEVNAVISMDGEIGIPIKSLSGGERSSADLAIDLAVIQFIEERTGKGINIMCLDEAFTGMDTINISETLEMLKASCSDKQLIIVDHNQISSEAIESRLTVVRDGQTSRIVQ